MSLGDWLDEVVAEQAADQGLSTDEWDEDDKLDAIGERLSRLSRREDRGVVRRHREDPLAQRARPEPSFDESRRAQGRLEAAISKFENRAAKSEERTAKAFESVASWMERSQADRQEELQTLQTVAEKLAAIEHRVEGEPEPIRASPRRSLRDEDSESGVDARLDELARRAASSDRMRSESRRRPERLDVETRDAVMRIAQGQAEVDARQAEIEARRAEIDARRAAAQAEAQAHEASRIRAEREQAERREERETLRAISEKLNHLEKRVTSPAEPPRSPARETRAESDIESRLEALSRRVALNEASRSEAKSRPERAAPEVRRPAEAIVVRPREEPRVVAAPPIPAEAAKSGWRHFGVDAAAAVSAAQPSNPRENLRDEMAALSARLGRMRAVQAENRPTSTDAAGLREGLASMTRSVADIAPRNGGVALEGAVGDLEDRLSRARQTGGIDHLIAPIEAMLRQVLDALRIRDPQTAAAGLERELRALGAKIEALAGAAVNPAILEGIRKQTDDVRDLLSAAAKTPVPVERLERQIGALADRIERLASNPSPRAEIAQVLQLLADARSQIEQSTPAAVLTSIERRVEQLAARIDEAIRRPSPVFDPRPIEDLAKRIEGVRASIERQAAPRPEAAALEAALRDINAKLDRAPDSGSKAVMTTLQDLTARLEEAFRRPANATLDPKPIEDLARRIEGVRASVEKQANFGAHAAKLEAALGDINQKLDRPAVPVESRALTSTLQDLTAKLEAAFGKPAPAPALDRQPLEDLARRIDGVRETVERHADRPSPDTAHLEAALREVSAKLDRQNLSSDDSGALIDVIQELALKIERGAAAQTLDTGPLENLLRNLPARPVEVDTRPIESLLRDFSDKFSAPAAPVAIDTAPIEHMLDRFDAKLDAVARNAIDPLPLELAIRELHEKLERQAAAGAFDSAPIERRLDVFDAKLDAVARNAIDPLPLELAIRELHEKLERQAAAQPTTEHHPLELAVRELSEKLDYRDAPQIDAQLIEAAADMLAKRLEQRGGNALDTEALVNQIGEIHGRLDTLNIASTSNAAFERTVAELIEELETTQQIVHAKSAQSGAASPLASGIAELRADQAQSDRRMESRFADVQDILEKLVDRLARMEEDSAREEVAEPRPFGRAAPNFDPLPSAAPTVRAASRMNDLDLRDIPDRVQADAPRAAAPASFLLEPGASAPAKTRPGADAAVPAKNAAINAHIAAARRAAQAALGENATRKAASPAAARGDSDEASGPSALEQAQAFLASRKRPILLGVGGAALLAIVATLAVVELHGGKTEPVQKSELSAPVKDAAPIAALPAPSPAPAPVAKSGTIDNAPTGAISPIAPKPTNTPAASAKTVPGELITWLPGNFPAALKDAATAGDSGAETEVALRFIEGRTVTRDPKIASRWFELAATQGLPVAQYRLAALYEKGVGVTKDVQLARTWYLKAANAGNARAMHNLAVLNAEDGGAGKPDYAEATNWFRRAGQLGVRDSQFNLGVLCGRGLGVPQDLSLSWMWFSLAAQQGDSDAGKKRDEVAAKLDAKGLAAATKALVDFKAMTPTPEANDVPGPGGGWDGKAGAPQAIRLPTLAPIPGMAPAPKATAVKG